MIAIRVDAGEKTGLGHIMRTLTIAEALREQGQECRFFVNDESGCQLAKEKGFAVRLLGKEKVDELSELKSCFAEEKPDILLLDSYQVTPDYLHGLREIVKVAYMDDRLAFPYEADLIINYNIFARREDYQRLYRTEERNGIMLPVLLLGTEYVPLRAEFEMAAGQAVPEKERCSVFVSTGGSDPLHIAQGLIQKIAGSEKLQQAEYHFVVGPYAELELPEGLEHTVFLHRGVKQMGELMAQCDFAVSASGVTLYELCGVGIPTICYTFADNQIPSAAEFAAQGLMRSAGDAREGKEWFAGLAAEIESWIEVPQSRLLYQQRLKAESFGGGAARLAKRLCAFIKKKISVVIPCYNVERYIDRCIQSLAEQTIGMDALQLIFVDDASTDRTRRKLEWWAKRYPDSIEVICLPENRRQGGARNAGLQRVLAPYTGFVDSDDWIATQMYEKLYEVMQQGSYDFVNCYAKRAFDTRETLNPRVAEDKSVLVDSEEARKEFLIQHLPGGNPCRLFDSAFLRQYAPEFPEHIAYEDNYWMAMVKLAVQSYYVLGQELYYYYVNPNSTVLSANSGRHLERLTIEERKLEEYQNRGIFKKYYREFEIEFLQMYYVNSLHTFFARFEDVRELPFEKMQQKVKEYFPDYQSNPYLKRFLPLERELLATLELLLLPEQWQQLAEGYRKSFGGKKD